MDRGAWWATVHGVRKTGHDLGTKKLYTHTHTHTHIYIYATYHNIWHLKKISHNEIKTKMLSYSMLTVPLS